MRYFYSMRFSELPEPIKRLLFLGLVVVGIMALIGLGISSLVDLSHPPARSTAPPIQVSPLLFGTNLDLSTNQQQALPSTQESSLLQSIHVQTVRFSVPENPSQKELLNMAQYVKSINAVPLVSLHGPLYPQASADNTLTVQTMNHVFGKTMVYYEYGDEDDATDISSDQYTQSWNTNIPQLKRIALNAQFIGPATYRYDPDYLRSFLQKAQPHPDEVSWHEFACDSSWSQQQCLQGIGYWNKDIASARTIMKTLSSTPLPIMITEWNYAANARIDDGKSTDNTFMTTWTKNALQTLVANNVFASMQYSGLKTSTPLVSDTGQLTKQGQVMKTLYQQAFPQGASSTPTSTDTATATVSPTATDSSTATPTDTPTSTVTATPTDTPTATPTSTVSGTLPVSPVPSPTVTIPVLLPSPTPVTTVPTTTPTPTVVTPTLTPTVVVSTPTPTLTPTIVVPTLTPTPTPTIVVPTPTPKPTTYAVDGKNPTTYTVGGKTCVATQSNSTAKAVTFGSVKGTLYFQFSITCHAAWAKIVFSSPVAAKALGNAKVVRTGDGKTYTCDTGGNKAVAPGQTSCYTGMVYDGPSQTASAYGLYKSSSGTTTTSARLGPF